MTGNSQPASIEATTQGDLFEADAMPVYHPDPIKVRSRLDKILVEARTAETLPWQPSQLSLYQTIFARIVNFLPDEDARQLKIEFEAELQRLGAV